METPLSRGAPIRTDGVAYDSGVTYDSGPIRIEASQKAWLLTRALATVLSAITCIIAPPTDVADHPHDWKAYYEAKKGVLRAFEQFERWYGR